MQPQEFKITYFEAGDFTDPHGNVWCNILFEGFQNEPIRIVVKNPSQYQVGQTIYGHIEEKTSQAGKPYNRFYRDQKPDGGQAAQAGAVAGSKYQPRDDNIQESIARSVALKAAVDANTGHDVSAREILLWADTFLAWLQNSKSALPTATPSYPQAATIPGLVDPRANIANPPGRQWNSVGQNRQEEPLPDEPMGFDLRGEEYPVDQVPFN